MHQLGWLLDGDPAIRWQVMRDLIDSPPSDIATERARVGTDGWGGRLLSEQDTEGTWGGGLYSPKWISTTYTLLLLRHLGLDPDTGAARDAIDSVVGGATDWKDGSPFFGYLGETCVTGMNLALAAYYRVGSARTAEVFEWLLGEQLEDGGWNCDTVRGSVRSSFHTTITVLEGLLEFERSGLAVGRLRRSRRARGRAHDYLLSRRLGRSLRSGELINPSWNRFSFPPRWWFDRLRGLDYLQDARVGVDERWEEPLELLRGRARDGLWNLQNHHSGREFFRMEDPGKPSRWNTLRALRVLRWVDS